MQHWLVDEQSGEMLFLPFQTDGNPYKSKVLLIGQHPEPLIQLGISDVQILAETLVDRQLFQDLFQDEIRDASREYKGSLNFAAWMKEQLNEQVVLSSLNCLNIEEGQLKQLKKGKDALYLKGFEVFKEVLNEFEPTVVILQGATAYKQFVELFKGQLSDYKEEDLLQSVQLVEGKGTLATLRLNSGATAKVLACRSLGSYGKTGKSFEVFKKSLEELFR